MGMRLRTNNTMAQQKRYLDCKMKNPAKGVVGCGCCGAYRRNTECVVRIDPGWDTIPSNAQTCVNTYIYSWDKLF